jgi:hypothetical protein
MDVVESMKAIAPQRGNLLRTAWALPRASGGSAPRHRVDRLPQSTGRIEGLELRAAASRCRAPWFWLLSAPMHKTIPARATRIVCPTNPAPRQGVVPGRLPLSRDCRICSPCGSVVRAV